MVQAKGGAIDPRYASHLIFFEKRRIVEQPLKLDWKWSPILILSIKKNYGCLTQLKTELFNFIKLATDFLWQPSLWPGETSPFWVKYLNLPRYPSTKVPTISVGRAFLTEATLMHVLDWKLKPKIVKLVGSSTHYRLDNITFIMEPRHSP